jgi:hypothetical protein
MKSLKSITIKQILKRKIIQSFLYLHNGNNCNNPFLTNYNLYLNYVSKRNSIYFDFFFQMD